MDILYELDQKCGGLWKYDWSDDMYKRLREETVEVVLRKKGECKHRERERETGQIWTER